jgi:hypothetical protein
VASRRGRSSSGRSGGGAPPSATLVRQWHGYLSAFVAPTVLFFSISGALQVVSLHEAHGGYRPPAFVRVMSRLHRDQRLREPPASHEGERARLQTPVAGSAGDWIAPVAGPAPPARPPAPAPFRERLLKAVVFFAACCLAGTTLLGLWIAFIQHRRRGVLALLVLAGVAAPALLIFG